MQETDTLRLFDDIAAFIDESRALLAQGAVMELAGLDDRVRVLCEQVLLLSEDERTRYGEKLAQLLDRLRLLGEELTTQRDLVMKEIGSLPQHRKASAAYRQTDGSVPREEDV